MITKEDLKNEIEQLDSTYLELVFNLLKQFPHQQTLSNINQYAGTIDLAQEPLEFQIALRDEWT